MSSLNKLLKLASKFENEIKKLSQQQLDYTIDKNDQENVSSFLELPKNKNKLGNVASIIPLKIDGVLGKNTRDAIQKAKEILGEPYIHDEELFQKLKGRTDLPGINREYWDESGSAVKY